MDKNTFKSDMPNNENSDLCSVCGAKLEPGAIFCTRCGAKVGAGLSDSPTNTSGMSEYGMPEENTPDSGRNLSGGGGKPHRKLWLLFLIPLLALVICLLAGVFKHKDPIPPAVAMLDELTQSAQFASLDNVNHPFTGEAAADKGSQEAHTERQHAYAAYNGLALDSLEHVEQGFTQDRGNDHEERELRQPLLLIA